MDNKSVSDVKLCGCKGIRICLLCEQYNSESTPSQEETVPLLRLAYCGKCTKLHLISSNNQSNDCNSTSLEAPRGIFLLENFITPEEENRLAHDVDEVPWSPSQSGRRKQDYGPQVNFKKEKISIKNFTGFPRWSETLVKKLKLVEFACQRSANFNDNCDSVSSSNDVHTLADYKPVELCALEYVPERGSCIVPHMDDRWVWGNRLVTVNLLSETILTLHHRFNLSAESEAEPEFKRNLVSFLELSSSQLDNCAYLPSAAIKVEIDIRLPQRSLFILYGDARYRWLHSVKRENIRSRRVALTFRELAEEFLPDSRVNEPLRTDASAEAAQGEQEKRVESNRVVGGKLLELAATFNGKSVYETLLSRSETTAPKLPTGS